MLITLFQDALMISWPELGLQLHVEEERHLWCFRGVVFRRGAVGQA
jgi:hypothetical protein